jgi:Mn2+/Fe2+ NRAMP family transporter
MLISGDRSVMGKYRNGKLSTAIGWLAVALMATAAITLLVQSIRL